MEERLTVVVIIISISLIGAAIVTVIAYFCRKKKERRVEGITKDEKQNLIRHRPPPLTLGRVCITRQQSQLASRPLVITPTSPNPFVIPSRSPFDDYPRPVSTASSPEDVLLSTSPQFGSCPLLTDSVKLHRTLSDGHGAGSSCKQQQTPHGKLECFLKHDREENNLAVQILGKKGHSLSWLTGISNPYIRVSLISNDLKRHNAVLSSKILNLPLNPRCELNGVTEESINECFVKFVIVDFDRFSRSEFVAEVLVPLGDLENLSNGVTVCEDLILQQKAMLSRRGSFLISLCNQSVAQQLQVIIMKADGISFKGKELFVRTILNTAEVCYNRKSKGYRKNSSYIFNEKLVFDVSTEELKNACLVLEVSKTDSMLLTETKLGYVKLGLSSNMALEMRHWSEMLASPQKQIAEWHQLHHR